MRIVEIVMPLRTFTATVRVVVGSTQVTLQTKIDAGCITQARTLLQRLYGASNVLSVI